MAVFDPNPASRFRVVLEGALEARKKLRKQMREEAWMGDCALAHKALESIDRQIMELLDRGSIIR